MKCLLIVCIGFMFAQVAVAAPAPLPADVSPKGKQEPVVYARVEGRNRSIANDDYRRAMTETCRTLMKMEAVWDGDPSLDGTFNNRVYRSASRKVVIGDTYGMKPEGRCHYVYAGRPSFRLETLDGDNVKVEEVDIGGVVRTSNKGAAAAKAMNTQSPSDVLALLPSSTVPDAQAQGARQAFGFHATAWRRSVAGGITHDYVLIDDPKAPSRLKGAMVESRLSTPDDKTLSEWRIVELDADATVDTAVFDRPAGAAQKTDAKGAP